MRKLAISEKAVDRHFAATMNTSFTKVYSDIERERMRRITDQQLVTYPMACQYLKMFRELKEATIQNEEESTAKLQSCFSFLDGHQGKKLPAHGGLVTLFDYLAWAQGLTPAQITIAVRMLERQHGCRIDVEPIALFHADQ